MEINSETIKSLNTSIRKVRTTIITSTRPTVQKITALIPNNLSVAEAVAHNAAPVSKYNILSGYSVGRCTSPWRRSYVEVIYASYEFICFLVANVEEARILVE